MVVMNLIAFYLVALFTGSLVAMLDKQFSSRQLLKEDQTRLMKFIQPPQPTPFWHN